MYKSFKKQIKKVNYFSDSASRLPTVKKVWGREGRIADSVDIADKTVGESQITEIDKNRQETISALFSGILPEKVCKDIESN